MSDFQLIKERIYKEERIEKLLELLECEEIDTEQRGKLYVASLPKGDNKRSVQVKNNVNLGSNIRSRNINGDIFDVVSYILYDAKTEIELKENLPKSKFWICQQFGYLEFIDEFYKETSDKKNETPKYNQWLSKFEKKTIATIVKNAVLNNEILNRYGKMPYLPWIEEGIDYHTQLEFGVGIDVQSERITFPIHNLQGELIGVKGRYCGKNKEIEERYKYLYVEPCNKSLEFFNLHRALPYIKRKREVIVVEGAKTTMKCHTWGFHNVISIEGDSLSDVQIQILKDLGLDIKFIFAWDKDKDAEYVKSEVNKLQGRLRYAMLDGNNLLNKKDSPVDKGEAVWKELLKNHIYRIR